jgi:hypothetical protein
LGDMYESGFAHIPLKPLKAYACFRIATNHGVEMASAKLEELGVKLTPDDVTEAKILAEDWPRLSCGADNRVLRNMLAAPVAISGSPRSVCPLNGFESAIVTESVTRPLSRHSNGKVHIIGIFVRSCALSRRQRHKPDRSQSNPLQISGGYSIGRHEAGIGQNSHPL